MRRYYGFYFAAYAIAVTLYLRSGDKGGRSWGFYVFVALVHGALVAVHYVGGLFSALLVASALVCWRVEGNAGFLRYVAERGRGMVGRDPVAAIPEGAAPTVDQVHLDRHSRAARTWSSTSAAPSIISDRSSPCS